jgi:hypothetical protein
MNVFDEFTRRGLDQRLLAEKQVLLDERDALLKTRQHQLEQDRKLVQSRHQETEQTSLRIQDEMETLAQAVYGEEDRPAVEKAA